MSLRFNHVQFWAPSAILDLTGSGFNDSAISDDENDDVWKTLYKDMSVKKISWNTKMNRKYHGIYHDAEAE